MGGRRYKLRSVKWRVSRHIPLFKTRGKLEPEFVSQVFVGSLLGTHRSLVTVPEVSATDQSINQSINFIYPRIYSVALKC